MASHHEGAGSAFWIPYWQSMLGKDAMTASGRSNGTVAETFMLLADACSALNLKPKDRLLEVGYGRGSMGWHLRGHCDHVGSDANLSIASAAFEVVFWVAGVERAPFADGLFDKILVGSVLQYLNTAEVEFALKELRRIIHPGGLCFLQNLPQLGWLENYLVSCPADRREVNLKAQWFSVLETTEMALACGWSEVDVRLPDKRMWHSRYYFDLLLTA